MRFSGKILIFGISTLMLLASSANGFAATPVLSEKPKSPGSSLEKKDPACVQSCRNRLSACSSKGEADRQQCYADCGGLFRSDNCRLVCDENYGSSIDNCLAANKACVSNCPEKKEEKPPVKKSSVAKKH